MACVMIVLPCVTLQIDVISDRLSPAQISSTGFREVRGGRYGLLMKYSLD